MSHISLKGNSYKYCTCDTVGPVPSFLLTARRGFEWAASTRPGPNNVRHILWAISKFDKTRRAWVGGVDENGPKRCILRRLGH